ncbi:MAG: amidohydrolase family protein, partial [Herbiconiux sp.]|nr:amidohydrolase family protein [Herbiconiux sp.]
MPTLWQNILVIAMDDAHGATPFRADVLVEHDRVRSVSAPFATPVPAGSAAAEVIDGGELLMHPGWVNAHTHSWEILLRGTSDPLPLEVWTLLSYPPEGVEPLPARLIYLRTIVAAVESLRNGVTTVLDDTGELPVQTPASVAEVLRAYGDAGIRATCTGTAIDVPMVDRLAYADEVLPAAVLAAGRAAMPPSAEVQDAYFAFCAAARELAAGSGDG